MHESPPAGTNPARGAPQQPPPPPPPGTWEPPAPTARPRCSPQGSLDCPNLEFGYGDADGHGAELSGGSQGGCFGGHCSHGCPCGIGGGYGAILCQLGAAKLLPGWPRGLQGSSLLTTASLGASPGVFGDCANEGDVLRWSRHNSFLLYQLGTFTAFLELLNMEIDNSQACSSALRKPAISLADSTELRVLLSVMYLMVENIRVEQESDPPEWKTCRETFRMELGFPVRPEEPFALLLFTMVTKFCSGHAPHFPMKKVLLLLWKVLLVRENPSFPRT
uniref:Far11/STRP N-terminal domain-containing protein n=1 Tax=Anas platyrhynchos platyrhynchos TaxID=8840 RepID=A0A493TIG5_ANAPP